MYGLVSPYRPSNVSGSENTTQTPNSDQSSHADSHVHARTTGRPTAGSLWPFGARAAVLAVPLIAIGLLIVIALARTLFAWPGAQSDNLLLIGAFILSLLPLILLLIDMVASQGGTIAFRDLRIDFTGAVGPISSITIPRNISLPGQPVTDSDTTMIIDALRGSVRNDMVVVDLEQGNAWWETRLLALCVGASRLGRTDAIVFVGTKVTAQQFLGWAPPGELVQALLQTRSEYRAPLERARVAAAQWELVPIPLPGEPCPPPALPWMTGPALDHPWMAWRQPRSQCERNEFTLEQYLANELGQYEPPEDGGITIVRLQALAGAVLRTTAIDQRWSDRARIDAFLGSDDDYIAVTDRGAYVGVVSRAAGQTAVLAELARQLEGDALR